MADTHTTQSLLEKTISQVDQLTANIQRLQGLNTSLAATATSAAEAGRQTQQVATSIAQVARATRMLSINASVEAARAGEMGAGFGVVATEVGELASRTRIAADEATRFIQNCQDQMQQLLRIGESLQGEIASVAKMQAAIEQTLQMLQHQVHHGPASASTADVVPLVYDDTTMSTGDTTIDHQHRKLIEMINQLDAAVAAGHGKQQLTPMLDFLAKYVVDHFKHEECVFTQKRCPHGETNKKAHAQLLSKYGQWRKQYDESGASLQLVAELNVLLKDWLVKHICGVDHRLREPNTPLTINRSCHRAA